MFLAATLVPNLQFYPLASHLSLEWVVIKHCGNVLHVELVSGIAEKKVSLADPSVAHEYYIKSF